MKLFMIEDNVSVCEMIEMFFMKEEIDVMFVYDGKQGYEVFFKDEYDIVIIDLMFFNMDGMIICCKICEVSDVLIIILMVKELEFD